MNILKKLVSWWNAPLVINGKEEFCWISGGVFRRKDWWLGRLVDTNGFGDYAHSDCAKIQYYECGL